MRGATKRAEVLARDHYISTHTPLAGRDGYKTFGDDESDNFYLDGETVAADDLEKTIKEMMADYPDGLLIKTDGDSTHGAMVRVMDSARNAGVTSISVDEI